MDSLLSLSYRELRQIKHDFSLQRQGYKFIYVPDTYEIVNFYLPFYEDLSGRDDMIDNLNTNDDLTNKKAKKNAEDNVCYNYFFDKLEPNKIQLIDEYKAELDNYTIFLINKIKQFTDIAGQFNQIVIDSEHDIKSLKDHVEQNLDLIVFVLMRLKNLENLRTDNGGYRKIEDDFFAFVNKFFSVKNIESLFEANNISIPVAEFKDITYRYELVRAALDSYISELIKVIGRTPKNPDSRRKKNQTAERYMNSVLKNIENTETDLYAIDRIAQLNQKLIKYGSEHSENTKVLFIYVSSAPSKNRFLFNLQPVIEMLPSVTSSESSIKFNFHRNIQQVFLFNRINDYIEANKNLSYTNEELISMITMYTYEKNIFEVVLSKDVQQHVINIVNELSEKSELLIFSQLFKDTKKDIKNLLYKEEYKTIKLYLEEIKNHLEKHDVNLAELLAKRNKIPQIEIKSPRRALIKNPLHHYPFLAFYKLSDPKQYPISKFFDRCCDPDILKKYTNAYTRKIASLNELVNVLKSPNGHSDHGKEILSDIFKPILATFIQFEAGPDLKSSNEEQLIQTLTSKIKIFRSYPPQNTKDPAFLEKLITDLEYFVCALKRREGKITNVQFYTEYIDKYPSDIRFKHEFVIFQLELFYEKLFHKGDKPLSIQVKEEASILKNSLEVFIPEVIKGLEESIDLPSKNKYAISIIRKSILAMRNSLLSINLFFQYEAHEYSSFNSLNELRLVNLTYLKEESFNCNIDYDSVDSFNHTEAMLEYLEYLALVREHGDLNHHVVEINNKIVEVRLRANKFLETASEFIDDRFKDIIKDILAIKDHKVNLSS